MTEHNIIVRLVDSEGKILDERAVDDMWHLQGALGDIVFCNDVILPGYSITITETADKRTGYVEHLIAETERFFIDHGTIHDRVTGKHVVTDGEPPFEDGVEQVCELLNSLSTPTAARCDLCGFGECLTATETCPRRTPSLSQASRDGAT